MKIALCVLSTRMRIPILKRPPFWERFCRDMYIFLTEMRFIMETQAQNVILARFWPIWLPWQRPLFPCCQKYHLNFLAKITTTQSLVDLN